MAELLLAFYTYAMALSIKSDDADRLARELAAETGESLTEVVVTALAERLARERARRSPRMSERLRKLQADVATLPIQDPRPADEILGYNGIGLPS